LFEVSLTKPAYGTFLGRCAFFNFFGCSDAKQQIREREPSGILYTLLFGARVAEIHLLHFAFQNLRQEDRRVIAFANVTQHLSQLDLAVLETFNPNISATFLCQNRLRSSFLSENWCTGFSRHLTKSRYHTCCDRPVHSIVNRSSPPVAH